MITVLVCKCPNAVPKARRFLEQNGVEDWIDFPVVVGKENVLRALAELPEGRHEIQRFLNDVSRFIIFVGYDDGVLEWADIAHGDEKKIAEAEWILERFA